MTRVDSLAGHPIAQYVSPNAGGAMHATILGIVLHVAQGTYDGTIAWQMNPHQTYGDGTEVTTSSTWVVGRELGQWAQMVDMGRIAWCQRDGSREWLSIELAGFAPNPPSAWQIEACAQLLALVHVEYGVPLRVATDPGNGGLGHHSMDREWMGEEWGHEACPGVGVITSKSAIVERAREIITEGEMVDPVEVWQVEFQDYLPNDKGVQPAANTKHALFSARRDAAYARKGVDAIAATLTAGLPVTLSDAQLDALALKVAAHLTTLRFAAELDPGGVDVLPAG